MPTTSAITHIKNPLTIIGIFAAIAEIAMTTALTLVTPEVQKIFVWFVMAFPTFLVALFFLFLWKNPKNLYAPSDFQSDDGWLRSIGIIDNVIKEITEAAAPTEANAEPDDGGDIAQLKKVKAQLESARNLLVHKYGFQNAITFDTSIFSSEEHKRLFVQSAIKAATDFGAIYVVEDSSITVYPGQNEMQQQLLSGRLSGLYNTAIQAEARQRKIKPEF